MTSADRFYCVCCNRLERLEYAERMFKTGYYRVLYPLGCCVSCREAQALSGTDARTGGPSVEPFAGDAVNGGEDSALVALGASAVPSW